MISKERVIQALELHWNIGPAAKELSVGYSTLRRYIKLYNIDHDSRKSRNGPIFDKKKYETTKNVIARRNRKLKLLTYKGGMKCTVCGYDKPIPDVYEFHHRDPLEKDPNWGLMFKNNHKLDKFYPELDKCDVLCANCHRETHFNMRRNT